MLRHTHAHARTRARTHGTTAEHKRTQHVYIHVGSHPPCRKEALHSGVIRPGHCRPVMDSPVWKWLLAAREIEPAVTMCLNVRLVHKGGLEKRFCLYELHYIRNT